MSSQDKVRIFISTIEDFPNLVEKIQFLASQVESSKDSLKEEWPLLLKIKTSLIDKRWFQDIYDEYLNLRAKGTDDSLIVFRLLSERSTGFMWIQFNIIEPIDKYLRKSIDNRGALVLEVITLFREYKRFVNTLREMLERDISKYKRAAEEVFWEKYKPTKTRYQRNLALGTGKLVYLRMVFLPSSLTTDLLGRLESNKQVLENLLVREFIDHYLSFKLLPDQVLTLFFEQLCQCVTKVMLDQAITRYYGQSFSINLQVEIRALRSAGLFAGLRKKNNDINVTFVPDYNHLIISINTNYIFDSTMLEGTLYHEIIHNLDFASVRAFNTKDLASLSLLREELIAVLFTGLREGNFSSERVDLTVKMWRRLKKTPITSIPDYYAILEQCGGNVHPLSLLVGLQLLCASLSLGNPRANPGAMIELVLQSKEQAIVRMHSISALSAKRLFMYYQRKIPRKARYFSDQFLNECISLLS